MPQLPKNAIYREHSKKVLSIGSDGLACIWDYRNDVLQDSHEFDGELIKAVASKSGQFVLILSNKPCVYRWNLNSNIIEETELGAVPLSIRFSSDENLVALGDKMNRIIVYDTEVMERKNIIKGHSGPITELFFINDNNVILSASMDTTLAK